MRKNTLALVLGAAIASSLAGCEIIVDFDRSQIPPPTPPDAGSNPGPDAGPDAAPAPVEPDVDAAGLDGG